MAYDIVAENISPGGRVYGAEGSGSVRAMVCRGGVPKRVWKAGVYTQMGKKTMTRQFSKQLSLRINCYDVHDVQ